MPSNLLTSGLRLLCLYLLITLLFHSCQKEERFGLEQQINPQASLLGESRLFFEQNILRQAQDDKRLQAMPNNPRHRAGKTPLWDKAENVQLSVGAGLKVPLRYQGSISLVIGQNKQAVPLAELSYLLVYKDQQGRYQYEVVTQVPDADYWAHRNEAGRSFSGITIVEDWWGRPLKSFKKSNNKGIMLLSSPSLISHKKKGEIQHMQAIADDCDVIVGIGPEGMYTVELLCEVNDGGGSGDTDSGGGGWGNPGGPGGEGDGGRGGGGYGGPQPPDYEERPRGGGGGGGRRRNDNPPPPFEHSAEEFTNEIDGSNLKPCVITILNKIKGLSNGSVGVIIQTFAQSQIGFGWKWEIKGIAELAGNANAGTDFPPSNYKVTTRISEDYTNSATELSIARTILHEAVHAYLNYTFRYDNSCASLSYGELVEKFFTSKTGEAANSIQHKIMVNNFINDIAARLQEYASQNGFNIDDPNYFSDMAWGGLQNTNTFNSLPSDQQERITNRLLAEKDNQITNGITPFGGNTTCNLSIE